MKASVDGVPLIGEILLAASMKDRMRGLLGRDGLAANTAMLIEPCGSIHTLFMRFDLDLIFLDKHDRVVLVCEGVAPARMVFGGFGARKVLEMQSGAVGLSLLHEGSQFHFED